jgi:glycerophosphoryl diester phosphodiesterase
VTPVVIAHRTCPRDAAENSLEGIRVAARSGADAVEIDVRLTADGEPVLLHDASLWRTTRAWRRIDRTLLSDVRRLRLRGSTERVPTLHDALDALAPSQSLAIDVKDPAAAGVVVSEVRNRGLEGRVKFWAQSTVAVAHAAADAPDMEVSLLRDATRPDELQRFLGDAIRSGARGISAHWSVITPQFVDQVRSRGLLVYAWCKTRRIDAAKVALLDGVVSDWPVAARAAVERGASLAS